MYLLSAAVIITTDFLKIFLDYPPREEPGSFSADGIMRVLEHVRAGGR
jgi:hypothetical protein